MKKLYLHFLVLFVLIYNGCSTITKIKKSDGIFIPVGIDSLTAIESDSITNQLFVPESKRLNALSVYMKAKVDYGIADSLYKIFCSIKQNSSDSLKLKKKDELVHQISEKLNYAEYNLKKAVRLNPFDISIKDLLASVYFLHGNFSTDPKFYHESIKFLYAMLTKEKGEHIIYYRLGENYYQLENWHKAYQNYQQAEKVLLATAVLNKSRRIHVNEAKTDSIDQMIHFRYVYYQAIAASKLYNTELALSLFQRAKQLAPSADQLNLVDNYTDWIQWDGGNIPASEKKNTIFELIKQNQFAKAKAEFQELRKELNTQTARDEIDWHIAKIEYEYLYQTKEGCQRLFTIIKNTPLDKNTGLPVDSNYQKYFDDCGVMFFKLGLDYKRKSKYKDSYQCFINASQIQWQGRWKSLLEVARLSTQDPHKTLALLNQIFMGEHNLNRVEKIDMLTLKLNALKRFGVERINDVRDTYLQIRSLQKD